MNFELYCNRLIDYPTEDRSVLLNVHNFLICKQLLGFEENFGEYFTELYMLLWRCCFFVSYQKIIISLRGSWALEGVFKIQSGSNFIYRGLKSRLFGLFRLFKSLLFWFTLDRWFNPGYYGLCKLLCQLRWHLRPDIKNNLCSIMI